MSTSLSQYQLSWEEQSSNCHNHQIIFNVLPYSFFHKSIFYCRFHNNRKYLARIQIPLLNLVDFKPSASLLAVSCTSYSKNVVSGKRNRFYARNSANQEQEAQISQEEEDIGSGSSSPSTSFLSLLCPLLKLFSAEDPSGPRNYLLEEVTSSLSTIARFPWGSRSLSDGLDDRQKVDPPRHLQLFEFEACPFCRRVREAITELDLSVEYARIVREALCELELPYVLQSVGNGSKRAKLLYEMSGSEEVPYLVDHNTGMEMREYKKILSYLFQTYSSART
ncbi:UNVERIFIED_CONTAM: hypothetical protein Sangu_2251800 [Sesamum angustifolium]|uniref:GST N-terminal domain-containing protein n=1 Tax=Sesamum angustifolium TaxID=2727405 RepID=A0AAW2L562_9LAMI